MKNFLYILALSLLIACQTSVKKGNENDLSDENFHVYLAFGQSNMEGSAAIEAQDTLGNSIIFCCEFKRM